MNLFKLKKSGSAAPRAFTIIEIALCLGIIGFALVAIIAALPRGLDVQKRNREETIIGHDADIWMSAIRSGSRGYDDLTNYVLCITNFWTRYNPNYSIAGSGYDSYTPTNSSVSSSGVTLFYLNNGARIVGLLSTPKFVPEFIGTPTEQFQSNYLVAYVRSMSGAAVDKVPQTNSTILGDAFIYRMIVENFPYAPVDTNAFCIDCAAALATNGMSAVQIKDWWVNRTNLWDTQWQLLANAHDFRLKFRWPVLPGGRILNYDATFRAMADGQMLRTNDNAANQPLFFVQASSYVNVTNPPPPQ